KSEKDLRSLLINDVFIIGDNVDNEVLDYINDSTLDIDNINSITIITFASNIDKAFATSWTGLAKFLSGTNIKLKIEIVNGKNLPNGVLFINKDNIFVASRVSFNATNETPLNFYYCRNTAKRFSSVELSK